MKPIGAGLIPGANGAEVVHLIDALRVLLRGGVFDSADPRNHVSADDLKKLAAQLDQERAQQMFGPATTQLVQHFQMQQGLAKELIGTVDDTTAARMNDILQKLGVQFEVEEHVLEVSGMVYDHAGRRLTHVEVRVSDRDVQRETLLGHGYTDESGLYRIAYPQSLYRKTSAERGGPELIARAYDAQGLLLGESNLLADADADADADAHAQLDVVVTESLFLVSGAVSGAPDGGLDGRNGRALPGLIVRAFDRDLRNEELLGSATTDAQGAYQIPYVAEQFRRREKGHADLVVRVFATGVEAPLVSSETFFNAPARTVVNLTVSAAALNFRAEWERYGLALAPLLDNVMPRDLTPEDLDFLAAETRFPREHLRFMHLDAKWRSQYPNHKLAASVYYALLRQGLPDQLSVVLRAGAVRWREAIKQAVADRQVQQALGGVLEELLRVLTAIAVDAAFVAPEPEAAGDELPVGVLLSSSDLAPQVQRQIVATMLHIDADADESTWTKSLGEAGVPGDAIDGARFAIQSIDLLGGHVPTLTQLQRTEAKGFARAVDLARLSRAQWLKVSQRLESQGALPFKIISAAEYAAQLADEVEAMFPTQVYAHQLLTSKQPPRHAVAQFLLQNPSFDLLRTPVGSFMKQANLEGIPLPAEELMEQVGKEARLARVVSPADRAQQATELLAMGMHSAIHIAALGLGHFKSLVSGKLTGTQAERVYLNAQARSNEIVLNTVRLRDYLDFHIPALPRAETPPSGELATWAAMFGNLNGCYCPPCDSAHGPAAYLTDLFEFLKDKDADHIGGGISLQQILFSRRPDLQYLELNCANATTPLPYIDLVIELLESHLAGAWDAGDVPQTPESTDGTDIAARLRALPEERNLTAPPVEADDPDGAGYPWTWPFDAAFARAAVNFSLLGMTPAAALGFGVSDSDEYERARLGIGTATWRTLHATYTDDIARVEHAWGVGDRTLLTLDSISVLGTGTGLLARSGLAVDALFALIASPLFAGWSLVIDRSADPCDIDRARLRTQPADGAEPIDLDATVQAEVFDLLHRILRLRLTLGWPLERLTAALCAVRVGRDSRAIDLRALSRLAAVATGAGASVEHVAGLLMALAAAPAAETADPQIVVAHARVRAQWLALLRMPSADYDDLLALGLPDFLSAASTDEQLACAAAALETLDLLRRANLDPAELRYLLLSEDRVPGLYAPRAGDHIRMLDQLKKDLAAAVVDLAPDAAATPEANALARRLRQVGATVERLAAITGTNFVVDVIASDLRVEDTYMARPALLAATAEGVTGGVVEDFIASFEAVVPAQDTEEARGAALLETTQRDTAATNSLWRVTKTCRLLALLGMTSADVRSLSQLHSLFDFNRLPPARTGGSPVLSIDSLRPLIELSLTQRTLPAPDLRLLNILAHASTDVTASEQLESLTGWGHSLVPRAYAASAEGAQVLRNLAALLGLATADGALAPWQAPATYARLQAVVSWMQSHRLTATASTSDLATLRAAALDPLTGGESLAALTRARFASEREYYAAITPAMDRLRIARRDALIARIVSDGPHPDGGVFTCADDLYAHLLIDVQMGPCQLTSRIVQAHSAVQLFVQRCLMNLETRSGVLLGDVSDIEDWRQWDWMKNYRVWEAARKVFLYPENWIEPELRDVKSPFFEALENELQQDEITEASAGRALRAYLQKLHEVARLDIRALYDEKIVERLADGGTKQRVVLHMVGRTHAVPHVHFYRQRIDAAQWTPWEKIEQGIDSDHLLLAAHNQRVFLFWASFAEVQTGVRSGGLEQPKRLAVSLRWITREFGQWSTPAHFDSREPDIELADQDRWTLALTRIDDEGVLLRDYVATDDTALSGVTSIQQRLGAVHPRRAYRIDFCTGQASVVPFDPGFQLFGDNLFPPPYTFVSQQRLLENPALGGSPLSVEFSVPEVRYLRASLQDYVVVPGSALAIGRDSFCFAHGARQYVVDRALVEVPVIEGDLEAQPLVPRLRGSGGGRPVRVRWHIYDTLRFQTHYHPYACTMLERLHAAGPQGLYRAGEPPNYQPEYSGAIPKTFPRQRMHEPEETFALRFDPLGPSFGPLPLEEFDFSFVGAYSLYNWEVFFHLPVLLADRLGKSGRYAEAQRWFHGVFDPTDVSHHGSPEKYWRAKPLFDEASRWREHAESLESMMRRLSLGAPDLEQQVAAWRDDPFNPHMLARMRLMAYMKSVVQKYVENLIAWADSLFRRDTIESINEATQLYVLAGEILGSAPVVMPPMTRTARNYHELSAAEAIDNFANALIGVESAMSSADATGSGERVAPGLGMLYFCIPGNARLQELREKTGDRLFKIRHCMEIDGRSRQLALFAPPIDPALLVRARAAGLDLSTLFDLPTISRPQLRFAALLQKALEFTNEVRGFGSALLAALEKRDGEQLAQLRAQHEVSLLKLTSEIRRQQQEEAAVNLEAARRSRTQAQARLEFYSSREFMSGTEQNQVSNMRVAHALETVGQEFKLLASILHIIPDFKAGLDVGATFGGRNLGDAMGAVGDVFGFIASQSSFQASMSSIMAGHERRQDEWDFQADVARKEVAQIEQQIIAAEIRVAIAEREQRNHAQQIAQSEEAETFLRDKFTNTMLYNWMTEKLSALHYLSYGMALDLARQAESAAYNELALTPGAIGFAHWDGGRKGLLAGDRLAQDLRRLELNYLNANQRRFELTSHLSLRRIDAIALMNLRADGHCAFTVSSAVLDLDFPGQTERRVKSIGISIPGVVGPYVGVHGRMRVTEAAAGGATASIVTSSGQNDAGVFQLDFRDERYLPFESMKLDAGTNWEFTLPHTRAFDYDTISDVILHVQYTAFEGRPAEGGARWSADVEAGAPGWTAPAAGLGVMHYQLLDLRHDFPDAWRQLRETGVPQVARIEDELFPYIARGRVSVQEVVGPTRRGAVERSANEITLIAADASDDAADRAAGFGYLVVQYELS